MVSEIWFFEGSVPTFHGGALGILYNKTGFVRAWNIYLSDECSLLLMWLCLTCPCHHRNYQLSASWQDYLDTNYWLQKLYPIFGECIGSTSGHPGNTGISPKSELCIRVRFGDPLTRTRSWQPGQRVAKTAWSSIHGYVTSQHFSP